MHPAPLYEAALRDRLSTRDFAETTYRCTLRGTIYSESRSPPSDTLPNPYAPRQTARLVFIG
ncbi:MAG: hypothetical protein ABI690_15125 [Chloroflexota bacterium]